MKKTVIEDIGLLIMRLGAGAMIMTHGYPKLLRLFGDEPIKFMDFMGLGPVVSLSLAVFAEFVCAILVILGFKTRLAAIPLIITMLTAVLIAHAADPFGRKELPLLYAVVFITILIFGAGRFSIDGLGDKKSMYYKG
ncbi:DoxX family protein [Algoriphagus halophytocola]|uniref:DoxX family protein n=1 Tax=Algoriphagus halophytocola TaxID=2991499 RepID=A0ABY6ME11_9BACT|nr:MULTISPECIES: DoxX family protein [unclassified Algoriphagus]UZD22005.1 DoxX family protein [Algoriphagus sp. TR-M5]WBL43256.1 DoxX family protein [Algoriphagus sp. TR-M9]